MKNQVAMEYIVTYGWALLAVVVLIGGLSYFGVFRPATTLPDNCFFSQDMECHDFRIVRNETGSTTLEIQVYLKNLDRNDLYVNRVQCVVDDEISEYAEGGGLDGDMEDVFPRAEDRTAGDTLGFLRTNRRAYINCVMPIPSTVADGSKIKAEIILDVYTDSSFVHQLRGEIFSKVQ